MTKVKISIQGNGLSYKGEVDKSTAGQILAICLGGQADVNTTAPPASIKNVPPAPRGTNESCAEYFNRHKPQRNPDKILTLAGYLKDIKKQESFSAKDLKGLFRDAGEGLPANFNRDFKWARKNGWIAPDPSKKNLYWVTNTGADVLRSGFSGEHIEKTKLQKNKKTNKNG